jgi:cytochrome c
MLVKLKVQVAVLMLAGLPMLANASEDLAKKNYCFGCHMVDSKLVGPSFKEVAKRYAGQSDALAKVSKTVREGGTGQWGQIPMPAQAQLSADDANALAKWILSLPAAN